MSTNESLFNLNAAASAALQTPQQGKSNNPYSWTPATNASYGGGEGSTGQFDTNTTSGMAPTTKTSTGGAAAGLSATALQQQQQQQRMAPQAQMQAIAQQASGGMENFEAFGGGEAGM